MKLILLIAILAVLAMNLYTAIKARISKKHRRKPMKPNDVFDSYYLECKAFYVYCFKRFPCTGYMSDLNTPDAFKYIVETYKDEITETYQANFFAWERDKQSFDRTLFLLKNKVMIELTDDDATILYSNEGFDFAEKLVDELKQYKFSKKEEDFEINIITINSEGLKLKRLDIKPTVLDIGLYYNDDFRDIDSILRDRLNRENDKGIVLLHGLPGTGKTTYLRHLVGGLRKKILFVSPSVASNLMNPNFLDLLIDNPNSVLVIEDAENIIMDRRYNPDSSVSNLLNLSDGLLSDCISTQIICTFNNSLSLVDSALMRKGRLIAKYEFGKLNAEKSKTLSKHFGFETVIERPMSIAEIANQHDKEYEYKKVEIVGFRQHELEMN
jgi:hypothetical protein